MSEFTIGGFNFRSNKLNAIQQWDLTRKLSPIIAAVIPQFASDNPPKGLDDIAQRLVPALEMLSAMPDADSNYVLKTTLGVVERATASVNNQTIWAPVWRNGGLIFEDIDMGIMMQIVVHVIMENLGRFFTVPSSSLSAPNTPSATSPLN